MAWFEQNMTKGENEMNENRSNEKRNWKLWNFTGSELLVFWGQDALFYNVLLMYPYE